MEEPLPCMQDSAGSYSERPARVGVGSAVYESNIAGAGSSFEEERIRQMIQQETPQPFPVAYQAPVVGNNSWPGIGMDTSRCTLPAQIRDLDDHAICTVIVDVMSMFNPKTSLRSESIGQHRASGSLSHLHHDVAATSDTREVVSARKDAVGDLHRTTAVNDVAPKDANNAQLIYISDDEEIDNRKNKKQRVYPTPISSDEGTDALGGKPFAQRNILKTADSKTESRKPGSGKVYPWDRALIEEFLTNLDPPLSDYKGYNRSSEKFYGEVSLRSLVSNKSIVKKKLKKSDLQLGYHKYQLKSCAGRGAFARVYMAESINEIGERHDVVLKVQKPACPWEFYIYRQIDLRVPSEERCSFGRAQNIHIYADCSFIECEFGRYGTLQDVNNSYLKRGQRMDEALCIFYTIEMLRMVENLHKVGLIHGDFKPDNLLIRCSSGYLGGWAPDKPGSWKHQGLCVIDCGRCIDMTLFREGTEFVGDCKTEGFRCTEMIEKKPWTFQVDTYGLCGVAHCLLHGNYLEIDRDSTNVTSQFMYQPKAPYKRYWNVCLWQNFFETLLNLNSGTSRSYDILSQLRSAFENYLRSDAGLQKKLRELLVKQNTTLLRSK